MKPYPIQSIKQSFSILDEEWLAPDLQDFPWNDREFLAWRQDKHGNYFVCLETLAGLKGFIFQMSDEPGRTGDHCDLCHASNSEVGVKAAFVDLGDETKRKVGLYVCSDLSCSSRVRGEIPAYFTPDTVSKEQKIARLQRRLQSMWTRILI